MGWYNGRGVERSSKQEVAVVNVISAPLELVEAMADLRFPARVDRRLQELMDRNNEGALTEAERAELEGLAEMSERISLVRAQALHLLGRKPI
jgi:hypothetical protein